MAGRSGPAIAAIAAAVLAMGCGGAPQPDAAQPAAPKAAASDRLPLRVIMQGLATDMAATAWGLWIDDAAATAAAARRVADHPRVLPDQMVAIEAALGPEFATFVGHDVAVHDAAVALAEAAEAGAGARALLGGYVRVQEGCIACHDAYRARVADALNR